jgi:hypothetical protein
VLYLTEGETERDYLKITLGLSPVKSETTNAPFDLLKEATKRLVPATQQGGKTKSTGSAYYDQVVVLFDTDTLLPNDPKIAKMQKLINDTENKLIPIVSAPCFEYVLLLHFENRHPPSIPDTDHALRPHGYDNHKTDPTRTQLMTHLHANPDKVTTAFERLHQRDQALALSPTSPLAQRLQVDAPYSNVYQVL